jgi:hypothetical protein
MAGCVPWPEPRRQQTAGVALEDQHRVIHVLAVGAIEEAKLLLAMGRIVGGIQIEQELAVLPDLFATDADKDLQQRVVQAHEIACRRRVLPPAKRGLGTERLSQLLIGDDLQQRIMAQAVSVIGVFVPGDNLVDALPQQPQRVMKNTLFFSRVAVG